MSEEPRPLPKRLADFEIIRRLGAGGMAEVFLAKKRGAEDTFKLLVLKRILPQYGNSRRFRTMFAEEAQLATRLNHPNIVQVYDFQDYGEEGQLLSMEYVEGPDLRKLSKAARAKGVRLPPWVSAYIVGEVAKGLHYAHERKDEGGQPLDIVHRDVSPQNVLISYEGSVKIADFGIASANLFREEPGVLKGKTAYMSPEQASGEVVDRRTDVFSLGVVFHELLTGRPLYTQRDDDQLLEQVRLAQIERPSASTRDIPPALDDIVMRALARSRQDRYRTARDLASAIGRSLMQEHQLIDAHHIEGVIAQLISREHTSPGVVDSGAEPAGSASRSEEGSKSVGADAPSELTGPGRHTTGGIKRTRLGREVRHVAVLELQIHGLHELEVLLGTANTARFAEQLRTTIGEIAYKRGARWAWEPTGAGAGAAAPFSPAAHAVVGLLSNPGRAALDAAWLAVDVHEAIAGASDDLPIPLSASVGIVRGIASGTRDKHGNLGQHELQRPAEELATLLGRSAPPGGTWVAGGIYRLVRRDFVWGDAPSLDIPSAQALELPAQMRAYSLVRPLTREEKLAELAMLPRDLVGRDAELADLQAAFHHAMTREGERGFGRVTARVVYGEMGIGKSALISAFLAELPAEARVLRIEASPARSDLPFASVAEFVRELSGVQLGWELERAQDTIRTLLGPFLSGRFGQDIVERLSELAIGLLPVATDEADVALQRKLIGAGLRRFFARATAEAPLVVIVEGLQWCDRPSLELISALVRRNDPIPLLAILVTRPEDRVTAFIDGLVRIELSGLSADNQLRLMQSRLAATRGVAEVCGDLLPRAAGNPFFLLEMVDTLLERGALELREGPDGAQELVRTERGAELAGELPSTLEQLIADRLDELPAEERAPIDWLAVAGGPLTARELATLAQQPVDEPLTRLAARGLCDQRGELLDVRHPLTRDVAYAALERTSRVRMHRALAELLVITPLARGLSAAIVARHFARGNVKGEAARLYLDAAEAARKSQQIALAVRYLRRVVALLPPEDLRLLEVHEALEATCRDQGRWRERLGHLKALRQLALQSGSPYWAALALLRTARWEFDSGHLARGLSNAQQAERLAREHQLDLLSVQCLALTAEMLRDLGDMQGALAACDRALEIAARPSVPPRLRADVLRTRGTLLRRVGRVQEAVEAHVEAIAVFRKEGARRLEARAKNSLGFALFVLGQFEDAIALAKDAIRIDLEIGGRFQIAKTISNIGQCYSRLGDYPRAEAYLKHAREAHERFADQDSRADTLLATAETLLEMGQLDEASTFVGDAGALTAVTESAYDSVHEKVLRALLARANGDSGAAVMHAFDARQSAEAQAYVAFHFYAMAVEAAARVDIGEHHIGILLATTALGAIEAIKGSEYALETRALCCETLSTAGAPDAGEMRERAARFVEQLAGSIRDERLRARFYRRPVVIALRGAPPPLPSVDDDAELGDVTAFMAQVEAEASTDDDELD